MTIFEFPIVSHVPAVTTEQMRQVDRAMIEDYGITLTRMMENAGRNLAELVRHKLGGSVEGRTILVLAGHGNNGGGGMVAARYLTNWGARVRVIVGRLGAGKSVSNEQFQILRAMSVALSDTLEEQDLASADLIVDALIGYGLQGAPRGEMADWIRYANGSGIPTVALDTPSGLDTSTGKIFEPCIRAMATLTLALPKTGFLAPSALRVIGELYVADISVPRTIFKQLGLEVPNLFRTASIVRVH
jgi:NAD(P)H-hydrate epimerase